MSTSETTSNFEFGPVNVEVTHHEWSCGDGCCSSSGNTAEVNDGVWPVFRYGDSERDGHYGSEAFAHIAFTAYLEYRDYEVAVAARKRVHASVDREAQIRADRFPAIAATYGWLQELMLHPNTFGKAKHAQSRQYECTRFIDVLYEAAKPNEGLLMHHVFDDLIQQIKGSS